MIYAQIGEKLSSFEGMSEETIANMLTEQNLTFTFISKEVYKQKLAELVKDKYLNGELA
jgi:hypothetical protein